VYSIADLPFLSLIIHSTGATAFQTGNQTRQISFSGIIVPHRRAEEKKKEVEKYILEQMELEGRKTLENGPVKVTYVAESIRESVDKAKLEADMPELYEKYKKVTIVAPSLRVTVKKQ
jgi:hypothetical protein